MILPFIRSKLKPLVMTLIWVALISGCGGSGRSVGEPLSDVDPRTKLVEIPAIQFEQMESTSADQLCEAQRFLHEPASGKTAANYGELGMLCHGFDLNDSAIACYENAMLLDPDDFRWPYLHAQLKREGGEFVPATESMTQSLCRMPGNVAATQRVAAHCWLGRIEQEAAHLQNAETQYRTALALDPRCAYAHFELARVAVASDDFEIAEEHLQAAEDIQPGTAVVQHLMGTVLRGVGRTEESAELLRAAATNHSKIELLDPLMSAVLAMPVSSRQHQNRGSELFEEGRYAEATAEFDEAVRHAPANARIHCNRGAALQNAGRLEEAQAAFEEALRISPDMVLARFNLGVVSARRGDDATAVLHYEHVLKMVPNHKATLFNFANALFRLGRASDAREHYERLIKVDPGHAEARIAEARTFMVNGDVAKAIERMEQAHQLMLDDLLICHELARLLVTRSDSTDTSDQRGLELALQVMEQRPLLSHVETAAMGYAQVGNFEQAIRLQLGAIDAARRAGRPDLVDHLQTNLAHYQSNTPCRVPWREEDLLPGAGGSPAAP